jgi:hypothetical protein
VHSAPPSRLPPRRSRQPEPCMGGGGRKLADWPDATPGSITSKKILDPLRRSVRGGGGPPPKSPKSNSSNGLLLQRSAGDRESCSGGGAAELGAGGHDVKSGLDKGSRAERTVMPHKVTKPATAPEAAPSDSGDADPR